MVARRATEKKGYENAAHTESILPNSLDLLQDLPVAIYICDLKGRISFYNPSAVELWGRKPKKDDDLWCGSWKIFNADNMPLPLNEIPMAESIKKGRALSATEIIIERPDGTRRNAITHPKPIVDEAGEITGAINMLVDITDKKEKAEELKKSEKKYEQLNETLEEKVEERTLTLKKSEARYHKMIDEVQDYAILLLDKDGNIVNWNKGAQHIKGYNEREIIGKNFRLFYLASDQLKKLPEKLINRARTEGRARHEGWRVRKDGTKFWGSVVITALHDEDDNIIGFTKVTRDLTERKLAENRMKKYARDIEIRNKQLEEYAYVASHDLQEPLRKIQIFVELLEKNIEDKAAVKKNLERINSSAKRMVKLIKGVLKYSQLSEVSGMFEKTDLQKIIADVKEDFDLLIKDKGAIINHPALPVIKGVPIQMHQLFSNIISNSLKYSRENPIIEISIEKLSKNGMKEFPTLKKTRAYMKLSFKDNGIGFDQQYTNKVFNLFTRLTTSKTGTGIGLALCKKIVENHNGYIRAFSQVNGGTTIDIVLPLN